MDTGETWAINESLLQSYRSTFISSQSFLIAVGAIFAGKSATLVYVTAAVGLVVIWLVWFPVVTARHRIVDYHKYASRLDASRRAALCSERDYVHDARRRREANELLGLETQWRTTRVKIDLVMPVLFSVVWLALVAHEASA